MQLSRLPRLVAGGLVSVLAAGTLMGCSTDLKIDGLEIANAGDVVKGGMTKLKEDNASALQSQFSTISDASDCFFVKSAPDFDDVLPSLACGPIRRLGSGENAAWDTYSVRLTQDAKGQTTAELGELSDYAQELAPEILVSPTGANPAAPNEIPAPVAPVAKKQNKAAILMEGTPLDAKFKPAEKSTTLITPAGDIEVTAIANLEFLPAFLEVGQGTESDVPFFRPRDGQRAVAVQVRVSASTMESAEGSPTYFEQENQASLDTLVGLKVGEQTVPIDKEEDSGYGNQGSSSPLITCAQLPCELAGSPTDLTVVASVPTDGPLLLTALVNGETQTLDLASGERGGSISPVEYDRDQRAVDVNKTITTQLTQKDTSENRTCQWSASPKQATLSGFDARKGWAKNGQAWVSVSFEGFDKSTECLYGFRSAEATESIRLEVGEAKIKPVHASESLMVFPVPSSIEKSSLIYTPRGQFTGGETDRAFTAKPATVKITFKK